ncbi:MAG: hypothetical protein HY984_01835, partial [Candidatus Magasanikbacteria bacterium]|nr:hypothetical protein [Candidatus Magasanikbacteria bacterium]
KRAGEIDLSSFTGHDIQAVVDLQYENEGRKEKFSTAPTAVTINSDVGLEVRREKKDQGGREVSVISWLLTNTFHDLKDIRVEGEWYGDATLDEAAATVPAGAIQVDAANKKIVWLVPTMSTTVDVLALQFPLTINKKNSTQTTLTGKVKLRARDAVTGEEMAVVGNEIPL